MKTQTTSKLLAMLSAAALTGFFATTSHAATKLRDLDGDGIPNISDPDIDNDGIPNGDDRNVDGGIALSGPFANRYIGDHYNNDSPRELDIDGDGLLDTSPLELDIDGDGLLDTDPAELDIDGDGRPDSAVDELDTDGDGLNDRRDLDDDGDGILDRHDNDDAGDGVDDQADDDHDGAVLPLASGPVGSGIAPASLSGLSFILSQSNGTGRSHIKRLAFISDTTGQEIEGSELETFHYTYAASSATTGVITIAENSREYTILTVDFGAGFYIKQEFEHGRLEETKRGMISLALTP